MPRKKGRRFIECGPEVVYYKPVGIPMRILDEVVLQLDEFEAIRLADHEGMYHEDAAKRMRISRQTFGRTINEAHRKIADAVINGKAIKINQVQLSKEDDATT